MNSGNWMMGVACAAAVGMGTLAYAAPVASAAPAGSNAKTAVEMKKMAHSDKDIIETATGRNMQQVTTLVKAIKAAGLVDALKGKGPFTVFAPTNEAFEKLPKGTLDELMKPQNKEKLKEILLYHVHKGKAIMADQVKTMNLSTMEGSPLDIKAAGGMVMVNNAHVVKTDIVCSNGVIHWIDTVLMPPEK